MQYLYCFNDEIYVEVKLIQKNNIIYIAGRGMAGSAIKRSLKKRL